MKAIVETEDELISQFNNILALMFKTSIHAAYSVMVKVATLLTLNSILLSDPICIVTFLKDPWN